MALAFEDTGFFVEYLNLFSSLSEAHASPAEQAVDLTLIDLPYDGDHWLTDARSRGESVIGLDYLGQGRPDLVIRMNSSLSNVPPYRLLFGLDYAIIRREIRLAPRGPGNYVLVSIGGADINDQCASCAGTVSTWGVETILVRGPFTKQRNLSAAKYTILDEPANFAHLLGGCAWAITNGGTTMVEALSMGKAVYVVPQTEEETRFAQELFERGLLLGVGADSLRPPTSDLIATIGCRARAAVDGGGVDRIVGLGRELILSRPPSGRSIAWEDDRPQ
jgi:hypothetical protein